MVEDKLVSGWDDPRLPTLSGMKRRGYPAEAIRSFCQTIGITKTSSLTDIALLEFEVRKVLNETAHRRMAVLDPIKLILTNYPQNKEEPFEIANHPNRPDEGSRTVFLSRELWIEREDFIIDPPKKYFRLTPGNSVRLKGSYIVTCTDYVEDPQTGEVVEVYAECIENTIGKSPPEGIHCRTAIQWVSVKRAWEAKINLYDRLFIDEKPEKVEGGFLKSINPDSLVVVEKAKLERSLELAQKNEAFQFERIGYFCVDDGKVEGTTASFNRIVSLKDAWKKNRSDFLIERCSIYPYI